MNLPALIRHGVQPFEIGEYDQIFLDDMEVKISINGDNGKVFERVGGDGFKIVMSNEQIAAALNDRLVVVRRHYDPRTDLRRYEGWALRNLSDAQQDMIAFRLEWAMQVARYRAEVGPVAHADRKKVMRVIRDRCIDKLEAARAHQYLKPRKFHYTDAITLALPTYESASGWLRTLKENGGDPYSLRDRRGTGQRVSKFTAEELDLQGHFIRRYLSLTRPSVAFLFRVMKAVERRMNKTRLEAEKLNLGSRSTFYNRINALPDFVKCLGRKGEKEAKAKYNIVIGKDRGYPMDLIEADECQIDLTVILDLLDVWDTLTEEEQDAYRKASQRLWCSAVVDHATDYFLSLRFHMKSPSTQTALAAFELATRDKTEIARRAGCKSDWSGHGGFRQVRVDSATWYRSTALTSTISDVGGTKSHTPANTGWLRGTIERTFGIISKLTLNNFSGRTFSNIVERGDQNPRDGASVNIQMVEDVFLYAIVDIHHNTRSRGKLGGMTPRQAFLTGCQIKPPPAPPTSWHRRHCFGINLKRVITREGIRVGSFYYQSDEAQAMRRTRTGVEEHIRVYLWDLGEITLFDGELTYRVLARFDRLKGMSYWQATALLQELDAIDTEYTDRTQEVVDAAIEHIDAQGDIGRMTHSISSPLLTDEHIDRVERHIRRPLRIVEESDYTREVRDQDWSRTPFLEEVWGLTDAPEGDDLDIPKNMSEEAVEAKYGTPVAKAKPKKRSKNAEAEEKQVPLSEADRPRETKYFEEF